MCTFERYPYFLEDAHVRVVREQLLLNTGPADMELTAYCFMHDHLHALVEGKSERADARKWIDGFRRRSGFHYRRLFRARLWQEGYFDRVLRREESTVAVVAYVLANPVRGGLCATAGEYRYSGSSRYSVDDLAAAVQWRP